MIYTYLKWLPILYCLLCLALVVFLAGCSPGVVEEIAEGVTEGIIDQIEEYVQQKDKKK